MAPLPQPPSVPSAVAPGRLPDGAWVIRFSKRKVLRVLGWVIIGILALHFGVHYWHYEVHKVPLLLKDAVNVDDEQNFPTWYSAFSILLAGVLAGAIGARAKARGEPLGRYWWGICFALVFMSIDEVAGFHEIVNVTINPSWTLPFGILALLFALSYIPFLRRVDRLTAKRLIIAGVVYLAGAVALERFAQWYVEVSTIDIHLPFYTIKIRHTLETMGNTMDYHIETTLEEGLEMLGVLLMIRTFLYHLGPGDEVRFTAFGGSAATSSLRGAGPAEETSSQA